MKFVVIFVLAWTAAFAIDVRNDEAKQLGNVAPYVEAEGFYYNNSVPITEERGKVIYNNSIPAVEGRIINGLYAKEGQFPYQIFLRTNRVAGCGGSLIGRNWILSAAHCLQGASYVTVYLGSIIRNRGRSYTVSSRNIIFHHAWNPRTLWNDIALIKIPTVNYSSKIQPIRLPSMSKYNSYAGYTALAAGWGQYSDYSGLSYYLRWGRTKIITNAVCRRNFGRYGGSITRNIICMSSNNRINSCYGDSGGPLVVENSNILVGISALLPHEKCSTYYLAGFTRVSNYLDWIKYYTGIYYQ